LADDEKAVEGLTAMGFDEAHVRQQLRDLVAYFFEVYAASRGKNRWADKTPSYVDCLDFIESLFGPRCQYLVIFRHGLDVSCSIASMRIREVDQHVEECNGDRFAGAARYWALRCEKLLEFQARHPETCLELRYEVLTRQPEPTLRRVFEFLDEPWEPAVLRFHDRPHDHWIGLQDARAAESTGFLQRTGLWKQQSPEVVERMLAEAGSMLERLGYSTSPDAEAPP
jgi:hypothetical protein